MLCNKVIQLYCEKFLLNFTGIVALDYRKIVRKFRAKKLNLNEKFSQCRKIFY